jgi:tetratricopeptide (TPR) repeat protein
MRMKATASILVALIVSTPVFNQSVLAKSKQASNQNASGPNRADGNNKTASKNKFPGVGSIDDWKASVPEYQAGLEKMKLHRWDEAIAHFRATLALYAYQPAAWLEIGRCTEKKDGLLSEAEAAYRQCLKLDSQYWRGWKHLGNVLYMQKKYDEARQSVSNAMELHPPAQEKTEIRKMIQMIDSGMKDADTNGLNTGK